LLRTAEANARANSHKYKPDREALAELVSVRTRLRNTLHQLLNDTKDSKAGMRSSYLVKYSTEELVAHLHTFPIWHQRKEIEVAIDQIIPVNFFIKKNVLEPSIVNGLWNLQVLTKSDNGRKSDKMCPLLEA
jgi:hypothetical protein